MHVYIKGVGKAKFPDDMPIEDIKSFLRDKYYNRTVSSQSDILAPVENIVAPYNPTLLEKIGGGIADVLQNTGIISNNYGAQQIGKNIAGIGEFLPGIGDATAGDEFGRAVAKGDKFGVAMAGLGAIPIAGDLAKKTFKATKDFDVTSIDDAEINKILKSGEFEYHLSTEPKLEIGKSFADQSRTVSELGERGSGGVDESGIFSTNDPQSWLDQFEMELGQDAPEAIPKYLYKVRVKKPSEDGFLSEVLNKPSDVIILEQIDINDAP